MVASRASCNCMCMVTVALGGWSVVGRGYTRRHSSGSGKVWSGRCVGSRFESQLVTVKVGFLRDGSVVALQSFPSKTL